MGGTADAAEDFLEDYYDVVVLSTGLGSSILAAALAKSGKSVLHLDRSEYYGQDSASFSFTQLLEWVGKHRQDEGGDGDGDCGASAPGLAEPRDSAVAASAATFDIGTIGAAIARAHARHELKQERAAAAADEPPGDQEGRSREGKEDDKKPIANGACENNQETGLEKCDEEERGSTSAARLTAGNPEEVPPRPAGRGHTAMHTHSSGAGAAGAVELEGSPDISGEREGGAGAVCVPKSDVRAGVVVSKNDQPTESIDRGVSPVEEPTSSENEAAKAETNAAAANVSTTVTGGADDRTEGHRKDGKDDSDDEEDETERKRREESEDRARIDDDAAARLRSQDLRLFPLSYHGCRTRAGAPSDACVQECLRQKAAEEVAAVSGRSSRKPAPSHPAWTGRRAATKELVGVGQEGRGEEELHPAFWGYREERRPNADDLVRLSRSFNLDLTSQVVLATGPAVDTLVDSGVASYLEFKDMQALYLGSEAGRPPAKKSGVGTPEGRIVKNFSQEGKGGSGPVPGLGLSRVPCSKADVFGTKLLTPLEKRRLMRFLLFASDWGLQRAGEDVLARNEAGLGRGRSLRRPQNREAASGDFDADAHAGKPFREFLQSCGLPERVRAMITHALALLPGGGEERDVDGGGGTTRLGEATTEAGLEAVYRHLSALGRFGETAFIAPLYGVGELPQSFCRMAAVYGAVYVLRRQLRGALIDGVSGRCVGVVDESGRAFACGSLVVGGDYFTPPRPPASTTATSPEIGAEADQQQSVAGAPTREETNRPLRPPPKFPLGEPRGRRRLLRRIVLASGPVLPQGAGRGLCVLPPGLPCVGNASAVHVVSLDEETATCPSGLDGMCVLHLTTTAWTSSRDRLGLADEAEVVSMGGRGGENKGEDGAKARAVVVGEVGEPERGAGERGSSGGGGTPCDGGRGGDDAEGEDGRSGVLGRAARELLTAAGVQEIWSVGFSWDIEEATPAEDLPPNMVVCERPGQELYLHEVVVQAERAFGRLCPGKPFWPPPAKNDDEDDDQAEMLRAAASAVTSVPVAVEVEVEAEAGVGMGEESPTCVDDSGLPNEDSSLPNKGSGVPTEDSGIPNRDSDLPANE